MALSVADVLLLYSFFNQNMICIKIIPTTMILQKTQNLKEWTKKKLPIAFNAEKENIWSMKKKIKEKMTETPFEVDAIRKCILNVDID